MARFIARIELVNLPANKDNRDIYAALHEEMEDRGFTRQVASSNGPRYLPDATYFYEGEVKVDDVLAKAKEAVAAAKQKGRFHIAQIQTWTSFNLRHVEEGGVKG